MTQSSAMRQHLAYFVRRFPWLMLVAYYLYRFFQPKFTVGVVGMVWQEGRVLLVEHVFHPKLPWGLPGGWVGFNESPEVAVVRELREELGLIVHRAELVLLERTQYHHLDIAYVCQVTNSIETISPELLGYQWVTAHELPPLHSFHYRAIQKYQTERPS